MAHPAGVAHPLRPGAARILRPLVAMAALVGPMAPLAAQSAQSSSGSPRPSGGVAHAATIPLRLEGGRLVVPVRTPAGDELRFMVSLGASQTLFTESTAARAGSAALKLGSMPLARDAATTVPDASLTEDGRQYDGLVGASTLSDFDVLVDVPGGRLVLKPVGPETSWPGVALGAPVRLRVLHGVLLSMDVELKGRRYMALLELGGSPVVVSPTIGEELGVDGEGTGGLHIGETRLSDVRIVARDLEVFRQFGGSGLVIVGAAISQRCAMAISWAHAELRMCAP